ncbi:hypothetical protein ACQB60_44095 [Actinomycetota bacterium Odt1-20B]
MENAESTAPFGEAKPAVSVEDGVHQVSEGSQVAYRITVKNQSAASGLATSVSANLPQGFRWGSADDDGVNTGDQVQWKVHVAPRQSKVLTLTGTVGATPDDVDRLTLTACAEGGDSPVCATDTDAIVSSGSTAGGRVSWPVAAGSLSGVLCLLAVLAVYIRRKETPAKALKLPSQNSAAATGDSALSDGTGDQVCYTAAAQPLGPLGPLPGPTVGAERSDSGK